MVPVTRIGTLRHHPHEHDGQPCDGLLHHVARTEHDEWAGTCLLEQEEVAWPA